MTDATKHLQDHGIRPSLQRIAIMKYLLEHATHPTVDTIYQDLHPDMPTLSRTTVYNTLELFKERGAVKVLTIDSKNVHYDGCTAAHAHFLCKECGKIYDINLPETLDKMITSLPKHKVIHAEIYYEGICQECEQKSENQN